MSIDISHLETNPATDDISDDSVEDTKKKSGLVEHKISSDDSPPVSAQLMEEPKPTEDEEKEKEMLYAMLEIYKISFPKLKPFTLYHDMSLSEIREIKKSCDAQLAVGTSIGTYEEVFLNFLRGIEVMLTAKGFDMTGFAYLCEHDEMVRQDLRLVVIKLASKFSFRPEFRLLLNLGKIGWGTYYINHMKALEKQKEEMSGGQQPINNNIQQ